MTQNTTNDAENIRNTRANIQQIILQYEIVYLVKLVVFIFIVFTVFISTNKIEELTTKDFVGIFTFALTTAIDSVVLAKAFKVKGRINSILIGYISFLFVFVGIVGLVLVEKIKITWLSICVCDFASIYCCLSPLLEMVYDVMSHVQNEKARNY